MATQYPDGSIVFSGMLKDKQLLSFLLVPPRMGRGQPPGAPRAISELEAQLTGIPEAVEGLSIAGAPPAEVDLPEPPPPAAYERGSSR